MYGQIYVDAAQPTRTISSREARPLIRKLCAGFKVIGLESGDCVCMLSFNDVCLYQLIPLHFLNNFVHFNCFQSVPPDDLPHHLTLATNDNRSTTRSPSWAL